MKAKFRTYCAVCQMYVRIGEPIGRMPTGRWGHEACAEHARNKVLVREGYTYAGQAPDGYKLKQAHRA